MTRLIITLVFIICFFTQSFAVQHIINFGGAAGLAYSPKLVNAQVGDEILWQGDFSSHPLASISVPVGADSFNVNNGNTFSYLIKVAGTYNFNCLFHGFTGRIVAETAMQISDIPMLSDLRVYPNPFKDLLHIEASTNNVSYHVSLINIEGQTVIHRENIVDIDLSDLASGIYFLLFKSEADLTKVVRVVKE